MAAVGDQSVSQFVETHKLPQSAKVTQGYCTNNNNDDQDISTNDVLTVSCDVSFYLPLCGFVEQSVSSVCVFGQKLSD